MFVAVHQHYGQGSEAATTYQLARMQTSSIAKSLDVPRHRITQKSQHLAHGEADSHPSVTIPVTCDKAPETAESHDRLQSDMIRLRNWQMDNTQLTIDMLDRTPMLRRYT